MGVSDRAQATTARAAAKIRNFFVRATELQFIDDWHVIGLCGTGSKSCKADAVHVPAHRWCATADILAGTAPGARVHPQYSLCRAPRRFLTTFSITPVIVGLANRALDMATDMVRGRMAGRQPRPANSKLCSRSSRRERGRGRDRQHDPRSHPRQPASPRLTPAPPSASGRCRA